MTIARFDEGLPPSPPVPATLAATTVDVINGTDVGGLTVRTRDASLTADVLGGEVGNGPETGRSHVLHHPDDAEVARLVAAAPRHRRPGAAAGRGARGARAGLRRPRRGGVRPAEPLRPDGMQTATPTRRAPDITTDDIPCLN